LRRRLCPLLAPAVLVALGGFSATAFAQGPGTPPSPSPPAATQPPAAATPPGKPAPTPQQIEEARSRFQRALELAEDGDFDASLLELRRAYELAPSYRLLYNIGLVYQELKEYARSYDAFERYLSEGGSEVPPDRAVDVRRRLDRLRSRVGYLWITSTVPGAEVFVDDLSVGRTPFNASLRVNSGQRRVSVRLPGHPTETRVIELAGGEVSSVAFDLRLPAAAAAAPPRSAVPWISWGVTAALGVGATVTGVLALQSASSYDQQQRSAPGQDLGPAYDKLHAYGLTTDILLGATAVGALVSTYLTLHQPKARPGTESGVVVVPGGVAGVF
jgi:hypothetical protein